MPHQSDHRFLRRILEFISFGTTLKIHCIEILAMRAAQLSRNKYMVTLKPLVNKIVIKELSWRPQFHHLHFTTYFTKVGVLQENEISALHIGRYSEI